MTFPDQIYSQLGTRFYTAPRAEIVERIRLRDQTLLFYITLMGTYFGFVVPTHFNGGYGLCGNIKISLLLAVPLPFVSLIFTLILLTHHSVIHNLGVYIKDEFTKPFFGEFKESLAKDWDSSDTLQSSGWLQTWRTVAQAAILCLPIMYEIGLAAEIFRIRNKCHTAAFPTYSKLFWAFAAASIAISILVANWHRHVHKQRMSYYSS